MKTKPKFRVGQKVIATDVRAAEHMRKPDRPEGEGVVLDLYSPYGRQTAKKDKTPPYYVRVLNGDAYWYDEDELAKKGKS